MLYAIAGNGLGPNAELTKALTDLRAKAEKDSAEFWLLLEGKDDQTKADEAILAWCAKNDIWFEVVTSTGTTYDGAQDTIQSDDPFAYMLERIAERRAEDEDGAVLVLLPPDDADEDEALMALIENSIDGGVSVFQLNGAMAKLSLGEAEPEAEPEPAPAAPAKKAAKKAAAAPTKAAASKKAAAPTATAASEEPSEAPVYTEEELRKMGVPELTGLARGQGIETKGLGKRDLITAIMGQTKSEPEAAVVTAASAEGNGQVEDGVPVVLVVFHTSTGVFHRILPLSEVMPLMS